MDGSEAERLEAAYRAQGYPAVLVALAVAALIYGLWARADRRRASRTVELERETPVPDEVPIRRSGVKPTLMKTA